MTSTPAKYLPAAFIAFVFIQSLFFKFTGSYETEHIFGTLATWSGLSWFGSFGGYLIGIAELIAAILLFTCWHILRAILRVEQSFSTCLRHSVFRCLSSTQQASSSVTTAGYCLAWHAWFGYAVRF